MAVAAYLTSLKASSDSAAFTAAATTVVTAGSKYQLTLAARRVLDPTAAIVVKDGAATVSAALYTVDWLFGIVTFVGYTATAAVTVDASSKNMVAFIDATDVSISLTSDMQDRTVFGQTSKTRQATTQDFSADLSVLSNLLTDQDPGAATQRLWDLLTSRGSFLFEMGIPGDASVFRAWVTVSEGSVKASPSAIVPTSLKVISSPQKATGRAEYAAFGYGS